ncbi:MAG: hypothetical protein ACK4GO_16115 [Gemmobacter sp.]
MAKGHDWDAQRRETFDTFEELRAEPDLPKRAVVHFLFYAEEMEPDWAGCEAALAVLGFTCTRDEEEGMLDAAIGPIDVTPDSIWASERKATEVALAFDFWPDGWDMLEA